MFDYTPRNRGVKKEKKRSKPFNPDTATYIPVPEGAKMTGFSVRHFMRIAEENRIRVIKIGRSFFFIGDDLRAFIAAKRLGSKK